MEQPEETLQLVTGIFGRCWHATHELCHPMGKTTPELAERPANLISLGCAVPDKGPARAMQRPCRLLVNVLDRHEAHVRSCDSFGALRRKLVPIRWYPHAKA